MNIYGIPTIKALGKYPGGFALVKKISEKGGLRQIREKYTLWVGDNLLKASSNIKRSQNKNNGTLNKKEIQIDHEVLKNTFRHSQVLTEEQKKLAIDDYDKRHGL